MGTSKIEYKNFFNHENKPINRIAYSREDAYYKAQCIKAMLSINDSIKITIDKIGNICATLPASNHLVTNKSIIAGSHTDSVRDGGQFDGCLGVYYAMQTLEEISRRKDLPTKRRCFYNKTSQADPYNVGIELYSDFKVVIWACEESTRFGTACIGSSYISKPDFITNKNGEKSRYLDSLYQKADLLEKVDAEPNQGTLGNAVKKYMQYLEEYLEDYFNNSTANNPSRIQYVDRILEQDEISQLFEAHIEQSQQLAKEQIRRSPEYGNRPNATNFTTAPDSSIDVTKTPTILGLVTTIGKPLRQKINVYPTSTTDSPESINPIVTAACLILNNRSLGNASNDSLRTSIPEFNLLDENNEYKTIPSSENRFFYKIVCKGKRNHSGGTLMSERHDSNVGMSELIKTLTDCSTDNKDKFNFDFLDIKTPVYGMNQIQDDTILYLSSSVPLKPEPQIIAQMRNLIERQHGVKFTIEDTQSVTVPKSKPYVELVNDIRQNGVATANSTLKKFQKIVLEQTYEDINLPIENNSELIKVIETSRGDPIKTSEALRQDCANICKKRGLECVETVSYPGHDCAVALAKDSTGQIFLLFIPSIHGSHNPDEQTWIMAIEDGAEVFTNLIVTRFEYLERQAYNFMVKSVQDSLTNLGDSVVEFGTGNIVPLETMLLRLQPGQSPTIPELNPIEKKEILERY